MRIFIIDIDDTLTMPRNRLHRRLTPSQWRKMFREAEPNNAVINRIRDVVLPDDMVIICTGRKERNRAISAQWLADKFSYHTLIMRGDDDNRMAVTVKNDVFLAIKRDYPDIHIWVIDDDVDVRIMATSLGFNTIDPPEFAIHGLRGN